MVGVRNMTNAQNPADRLGGAREVYSVRLRAKASSSTSCSFCWFVLSLYPTLKGMTARDSTTYTAHLVKAHGLKDEISE